MKNAYNNELRLNHQKVKFRRTCPEVILVG